MATTIESPFEIGQEVWCISNQSKPYNEPCETCKGTGRVHLNDESFVCPDSCYMGQKRKHTPVQWEVVGPRTVGQIRVEITDSPGYPCKTSADNYTQQKSRVDRCMCIDTGIGSGNVYTYNKHVFLSKEIAQAECDNRNKTIESKE